MSEAFIASRLDFRQLPFTWDTLLLRVAVALGTFPKGDRRDWAAIRTWAEEIRPLLAI